MTVVPTLVQAPTVPTADCGYLARAGPSHVCTDLWIPPPDFFVRIWVQHTQITRGSTVAWPVFNLTSKPQWIPELQAFVDLCQISASAPDAFQLKLRTMTPRFAPMVQLLQDVRVGLLREFGGRSVSPSKLLAAAISSSEAAAISCCIHTQR